MEETYRNILKPIKYLFLIKIHITKICPLPQISPSVANIWFRKNSHKKARAFQSKYSNRFAKDQKFVYAGPHFLKRNLNMFGSQSLEAKIRKEKWACSEKIDYYRIFKRRYLWNRWIELYTAEEIVIWWRLENQIVTILLFRLYIKLMEIITTDGLGLQYLTKSKKLI